MQNAEFKMQNYRGYRRFVDKIVEMRSLSSLFGFAE